MTRVKIRYKQFLRRLLIKTRKYAKVNFRCFAAGDMLIPEMTGRMRYLKETPEGAEFMCELMEERMNRKAIAIARKMLARGKETIEEIAEDSGLPVEKVRELAGKAS